MSKISLIAALFFSFHSFLVAQQSDTIPFVLTTYNNIAVPAILNGTDSLNLMFHTGENKVGITENALKKLAKKQATKTTTSNSWGGKGTVQSFENNSLIIGSHSWDSLKIWVSKHSGRLTDGKFGPLIFKHKIIEVNYDHNYLVIHSQCPSKKSLRKYQKLNLSVIDEQLLLIEGKLKIRSKKYPNKFMIHTGFSGTLLLDDKFVKEQALGDQLAIISESKLRDSYGNTLITKKAILPTFKLGKSTFKALPISFFEGTIGRQKISVLGSELLKRYNTIYDLEHGCIYLQKNQYSSLPFNHS